MALYGISKAGNFLNDDNRERYLGPMAEHWPGIFKWSVFFFVARVQAPGLPKAVKRSAIDVISACWYAISREDKTCEVIISTVGSIEIATKLWVLEDDGHSSTNLPVGSAALYSLLKAGDISLLDRVVTACGGKPEPVAHLATTRLRSTIKGRQMDGIRAAILIDLINRLSRPPAHPLRKAFLGYNIIQVITETLTTVATQINATGNPALLDSMVAGFGYLWNCLESTDGVTWILQSLRTGLLTAFVESCPHFSQLDPYDLEMLLGVVKDIIPRYLVYRTVIEAVDSAMLKVQATPYMPALMRGIAKDVWHNFRKLSLERLIAIHRPKLNGKNVICDNVKVYGACFGSAAYRSLPW
jgi:hypothetical protein